MATPFALLKTSLVKKYWMSLTGIFLIIFLITHLLGNLPLLGNNVNNEAQIAFNEYTHFMTHFPLIKIVSYVLYFSILFHAIDGLMLVAQNKKARPVKYAHNKPEKNSIWASRNMGLLGTVILVFIVTHMGNFWFKYKFTDMPIDPMGNKDMYSIVVLSFKELWYVLLYVVSMAALAFHLYHGFSSAFQTLGVNHPKYTPVIKKVGYAFSIIVPAAFAAIPLVIYFSN